MTSTLQFILLTLSFLILVSIIRAIIKSRVIFSDFSYWLIFIVFLIGLSLFENSAKFLANILGVQTPVIAVFLVIIGILTLLVLSLALRVSILNRRFIQLTQNIALNNMSEK